MISRVLKWIMMGGVAVVLCAPGLGLLIGRKKEGVLFEKRPLENWPSLELWRADPKQATVSFERAFSERHQWRDEGIAWNAWLDWRVFGRSTTPNVIVGKEGWLFYAGDRAMEQYQGLFRPTAVDYAYLADVLAMRHQWLEARGIRSLVVLAPSKESIYPEFMPNGLPRLHDETPDRPFWRALAQHQDAVRGVDLQTLLLNQKVLEGRPPLYFKGDSHWNDLGAFIAYEAMMEALGLTQRVDSGLIQKGTVNEAVHPLSDLAGMMGVADAYAQDWPNESPVLPPNGHWRFVPSVAGLSGVRETESDVVESPNRLLLYGDSFSEGLLPFLGSSFGRMRMVQGRSFSPTEVAEFKPDVVIFERAERLFFLGRLASAEEALLIHSGVWRNRFEDGMAGRTLFDLAHDKAALQIRSERGHQLKNGQLGSRGKQFKVMVPLKQSQTEGGKGVVVRVAFENGIRGNLKWQFENDQGQVPSWPIHVELTSEVTELYFGLNAVDADELDTLKLRFDLDEETAFALNELVVREYAPVLP